MNLEQLTEISKIRRKYQIAQAHLKEVVDDLEEADRHIQLFIDDVIENKQ